jgi:Integrase core domain/GAG-pre-integrase domain
MEDQHPDWWKKKGMVSTNTQKPKSIANAVTTDTITASPSGTSKFYALATDTSLIQSDILQRHVITFADSACSDHCFVNKSDFTTYQPFHDKDGSTAAKGEKFKISRTGHVEKQVVFDGHVISLAFENAIHAPDLNHNLISIGRLDKAGCYSVFGGGGMTCLNSKRKPFLSGVATGLEGTMYKVEIYPPAGLLQQKCESEPLPSITAAKEAHARVLVFATCSHSRPTDIDTWHRRLGHVGYSVVEWMGRERVIKGMDVTTYEKGQGSYEDCIMGKHTRWPFDDSTARETDVLERIYIDLWGSAQTRSNGGKQYMMQMVDGKSTHTNGYYLTDKNVETTLDAFRSYHVMSERQTGKKLRRIRTDGGKEFCNKLWESYCKEFGIIHETTSPYSSQSNGVVKQVNRIVIEHVRVLLHDSGLPASMWCEVASIVIYLKDFIPTTQNPNTTPFEVWHGFQPDILHLRPFGCTAYAKIPVEVNVGKLVPCSIKCVLIGYFGRDAYCLLDKSTGKMFCSRDVIFKKGISHRTISTLQVLNEGEADHVILQPIDDVQPTPELGFIPAHTTTTTGPPPPQPVLLAAEPIPQNT